VGRHFAACLGATARIVSCPPRGQLNHFHAVNRHKLEVKDFACGIKPRGGLPAVLPGAGVWRCAWGDSAHCPCAARHAANENIFPTVLPHKAQLFERGGLHQAPRVSHKHEISISPAAISAESPLGATFVVNSEPQTGARPSARVRGEAIKPRPKLRRAACLIFGVGRRGGRAPLQERLFCKALNTKH
jgi:hypothetical protein